MSMKLFSWFKNQLPIRYTIGIIRDAKEWQRKGLADCLTPQKKSKNYFKSIKIASIIMSVILTILISNGFNKDFAGYIIASLSIFIGLNINLIIIVFDKFNTIDFNTEGKKLNEKIKLLKYREFFKQFTSLTTYSILISILLIVLLSLCFSSEYTKSINLIEKTKYVLGTNILDSNFSFKILLKAIATSSILILRGITYYYLFYYIIILLYSIGSAYSFIAQEYKNKKIKVYDNQSF